MRDCHSLMVLATILAIGAGGVAPKGGGACFSNEIIFAGSAFTLGQALSFRSLEVWDDGSWCI